MLRTVFFGSSQYCLPVLEALRPQLAQVITQPDKPVGRKKILTPSPVKTWAQKNNIPVATELNTDCSLGIVADYGKIIDESVFNRPKLGTFNIHFSKLPDLRGASPVQSAILRGDTTSWITIFKLEKTLDTGPILDKHEFPIFPTETAEELYTRLFKEVAKYITTLDFSAKTTPQSGTPTYCKKLTREDGFIEYSHLLEPRTYNLFRAMSSWPGLWTLKKDRRMKIIKCYLAEGKLVLDEIQLEGEKPKKPLEPH